jgi:hypothetical protein
MLCWAAREVTPMVDLQGYELRLVEDNVAAGEAFAFPADPTRRRRLVRGRP